MTKTNTETAAAGTCQICERACKMKNGATSLHGYNRPGHGFIVGQCRGAKGLSWEVSCELLRSWVGELSTMLTNAEAQLVAFPSRTTFFTKEVQFEDAIGGRRVMTRGGKTVYALVEITEAHRDFDSEKRRYHRDLLGRIEQLTSEIARQSARLAGWKAAA